MLEPDVFQYLDYRAWLRDWFAARAGRPSMRGLALRAGCSASLLCAIVRGKRDLDTGRAETLAAAMRLSPAETWHFVELVAVAHEPSRGRRDRAREEATRRVRAGDGIHLRLLDPSDVVPDEAPSREHHFDARTFAVSPLAMPEILAAVSRFHDEITKIVESNPTRGDYVYQMNVQLYPVVQHEQPAEDPRTLRVNGPEPVRHHS